jgi:FtsP/CotA-like multicopper oxidase with cupredoxin domain
MRAVPALLPLLALAACASAPTPPQVPATLQPPAGQTLQLGALASGVQIYDCTAKPDGSGLAWTFRSPEAALTDRAGKPLGKHYAGPTWEGLDGAKVVGEVKARDPGPTPTAIPWLLLAAKSNAGTGEFASTKSIQRVATVGGTAPAEACTAGQVARVPYTATYYFWR